MGFDGPFYNWTRSDLIRKVWSYLRRQNLKHPSICRFVAPAFGYLQFETNADYLLLCWKWNWETQIHWKESNLIYLKRDWYWWMRTQITYYLLELFDRFSFWRPFLESASTYLKKHASNPKSDLQKGIWHFQ